jgi:hypothetical protein
MAAKLQNAIDYPKNSWCLLVSINPLQLANTSAISGKKVLVFCQKHVTKLKNRSIENQ